VARPSVQVELRDNLQDERDTAGKFKLVESRLPRPAAPAAPASLEERELVAGGGPGAAGGGAGVVEQRRLQVGQER
jgi:hypothetical protein